jgi:hypothetical protein
MIAGCAHVDGRYTVPFGSGRQFGDGCDAIWNLGLRALKVYLTRNYLTDYPQQNSWSSTPTNLTQLVQTEQFATEIARQWSAVVFSAFTFANGLSNWWLVAPTAANYAAEYAEIYSLTVYLLTAYNNTGKTFVLQNWEGDWCWADGPVHTLDRTFVSREVVDFYAAFLGTRQRAVRDAVRDTAHDNVQVLCAFEVNRVLDAMSNPDQLRIVREIANRVQPDLVSYSAYDSTIVVMGWTADEATWEAACEKYFSRALGIINRAFPGVPVQIGEFGFPELEVPPGHDVAAMIRKVADIARRFGCRYLLYWEVFDNEGRGYYLQRPDGSLSIAGETVPSLSA